MFLQPSKFSYCLSSTLTFDPIIWLCMEFQEGKPPSEFWKPCAIMLWLPRMLEPELYLILDPLWVTCFFLLLLFNKYLLDACYVLDTVPGT